MNYLDFELVIGAGTGKKRFYPVIVNDSPAGEAYEFMEFPFNERELENQLQALQYALIRSSSKRRKIISPEEQTVQNFGRALFDALFSKEVRSRYDVSQNIAFSQGRGLRIKLRIQSAELASLPWEFLYDKRLDKYICLSNNTPIVRYLDLSKPTHSLTVTLPLSILGMIASPKDLSDLDVEREKQRLEKSLEMLHNHGQVKLTWLEGRTWQDLQRAMRGGPWHIFHFIGHGDFNIENDEGLICLEDDEGNAVNFPATELARLLADHHALRLIVLNSCEGARSSKHDIFSSTAAILVKQSVSAVLAMQYEITNTAAIELSRVFYEALAEGLPVDMAVAEARKAISIAVTDTLEWGTPILYMRSPDGVLFNLPQNSTGSPNKGQIHSFPPVDEQVSRWMQATASKSKQTWESYEDYINQFRDVLHKNGLDLDSEDEGAIRSLVQGWAASSKRGKQISPYTYNQRRSTISSFYIFARKQGWMRNNPIEMVQRLEEPDKDKGKPLDIERVNNAFKSIDRSDLLGKRDYALLCVLFTTGRTVNEVASLRCGDIAWAKESVTLTFQRCKGGKVIHAPLPNSTAQALIDYLVVVYGNECPPDAPVWVSCSNHGRGEAIGHRAIAGVCNKYLGTTKVERIKHTIVAMRQGVGAKEIESLLNINSFVSTEQPKLFR